MKQLVGASKRDFWRYVKSTYNLPLDADYYPAQYGVDDEVEAYHGLEPITGIRALIEDLQAHKVLIGLATTASQKRMDAVLDIFQLREAFLATTSDSEVSHSKPNPEVYIVAAKKLGVPPQDCIAIEDSDRGVQAAKSASMKCVQYWNGSKKHASTANLVIDDFGTLTYEQLMNLSSK